MKVGLSNREKERVCVSVCVTLDLLGKMLFNLSRALALVCVNETILQEIRANSLSLSLSLSHTHTHTHTLTPFSLALVFPSSCSCQCSCELKGGFLNCTETFLAKLWIGSILVNPWSAAIFLSKNAFLSHCSNFLITFGIFW